LGLGLRPNEFWSFTFFELFAFSQGKIDDDQRLWHHTSSVMALFANANRDPKRRPTPFDPADFTPYKDVDNKTVGSNEITEEQKQSIAKWRVNHS
jgi:hypothetical protein